MNGTTILRREVAEDIERLEQVEAPKNCRVFPLVRTALVRCGWIRMIRRSRSGRKVAICDRVGCRLPPTHRRPGPPYQGAPACLPDTGVPALSSRWAGCYA